jgi:hypothetical protein
LVGLARPYAVGRELLPYALVYCADVDRDNLFEEDRIKTFYCDQLDRGAIRDFWSQPVLRAGVDIIIDNGLHTFEANTSFLDKSLEYLRLDGLYVIEDIRDETIDNWRNQLETVYSKRLPNHEFALVIVPNSFNDHDYNLLIVHRPKVAAHAARGNKPDA